MAALIPLAIFFLLQGGLFRPKNAEFGQHRHLLTVQDAKLHYEREGDKAFVSTIGTIKNDSDKKWQAVYLEVQYFNETGLLVDARAERSWNLILPPHCVTAFRVRQEADKAAGEYQSLKVFVKDAGDAARGF